MSPIIVFKQYSLYNESYVLVCCEILPSDVYSKAWSSDSCSGFIKLHKPTRWRSMTSIRPLTFITVGLGSCFKLHYTTKIITEEESISPQMSSFITHVLKNIRAKSTRTISLTPCITDIEWGKKKTMSRGTKQDLHMLRTTEK